MKTAGKWLVEKKGSPRKLPLGDWNCDGDNSKRTIGTVTTEEMSSNSLAESGWSVDSMAPCDGFGAMNDSFLVSDGCWWGDDDNTFKDSCPLDMKNEWDAPDFEPTFVDSGKQSKQRHQSPARKSKKEASRRRSQTGADSSVTDSVDSKSRSVDSKSRSVDSKSRLSRDGNSKKRSQRVARTNTEPGSSSPRRSRIEEGSNTRSNSCHAIDRDRICSREPRKNSKEPSSPVRTRNRRASMTGRPSENDRPASPRKTRSYPESPKRIEKRERVSRKSSNIKLQSAPLRTDSSKDESKSRSHKAAPSQGRLFEDNAQQDAVEEGPSRPSRTRRATSRRQSVDHVLRFDAPARQRTSRRASVGM